jgi:hypothetical protein
VIASISPSPVLEAFTEGFGLSLLIVLGCALLAITIGVVRRFMDV